jgi:hypothetical protein
MLSQIKDVLIERIHRSLYFAIQFDEITDVANFAQLMFYIGLMDKIIFFTRN